MHISPIRAAKIATSYAATRFNMWKFAGYSDRRFRDDVRYNLQAVTDGFLPRIGDSGDDAELLGRICEAFSRAAQQEKSVPAVYQPKPWWQQARQGSLRPVIEALLTRNIGALRKMYQNFYRDPCSSGLLGPPNGMRNAYFGGGIKDVYRRFYLGHVLCRLDYWKEQTEGRFAVRDLAGPGIGNPFGVVIEGTHIGVGAEYSHYCAHRVDGQLGPEGKSTVAEIEGGFGGMAYYLLRTRPQLVYVDFDAPERIALTAYYLSKAFPKLRVLLYGEGDLTTATLARTDVALMPIFSLPDMAADSVDITFSSHSISKAGFETIAEYLRHIDRMTRRLFFCITDQGASDLISDLVGRKFSSFTLTETRSSGWHSHKIAGAGVGGARRLAESVLVEQLYRRSEVRTCAQSAPS